tara:strand:- start:576 stop:1850 length:1275 start_codon:yes stop_codon:yes gene_type:complete
MRIDKRHILNFLLFFPILTFSQNNTGSPYSLNELGELNFLGNVSSVSMGGVESSIDSIEFNINNPSSLAKLKTTNYQIGTFYKSTGISNSLSTDRYNSANINYVAIGIPVKNFGFGFGVLPYSSTGFSLQASESYSNDNSIDSRLFFADGNINRAFLSGGISLNKNISVGATVNYNFGKFSYQLFNQYDEVSYGIYSNSSSELSGFNYNLSTSFTLPLKDDLLISVVYNYHPSNKLKSNNSQSIFTATSSTLNTESLGDFVDVDLEGRQQRNTNLTIPQKSIYSIGLEKKNNWFVGIQYEDKLSSTFNNEFLNIENVSYRDSKVLSLGGYYIPDASSLTSYWKRVKYRFGIKNEQKSIIVNNLPVNHFILNLGLGLPLSGLSKANLGLEFGKVGNDKNAIEESYFALRLGLSLNDIWFIKRKYN